MNIDLMKLVFKVGVAHLASSGDNLTKTSVEVQRAQERKLYELGILWNEGQLVRKPPGCEPTLSG